MNFIIYILGFCLVFSAFAKTKKSDCSSFAIGVTSPMRNEIASLNCKDNRVFISSDLFLKKNKKKYFLGEYKLKNERVTFSKKVLAKLIKNSKESTLGQVKQKHTPYIMFEEKVYTLNEDQFKTLKEGVSTLLKNSSPYSGVLVKKGSVTKYVKRKNKGMVSLTDMDCTSFCSYNGLYWERF